MDADKRSQWFCGGDTLSRAATATLLFQHSRITDEPTPARYAEMDKGGIASAVRVTEFDPPRSLAFTWPSDGHESRVHFELFTEGDKVRLVITHDRLKDMAEQLDISGGWHAHLDALQEVLAGRKPQGFWASIDRLEAEYRRRFGA